MMNAPRALSSWQTRLKLTVGYSATRHSVQTKMFRIAESYSDSIDDNRPFAVCLISVLVTFA